MSVARLMFEPNPWYISLESIDSIDVDGTHFAGHH